MQAGPWKGGIQIVRAAPSEAQPAPDDGLSYLERLKREARAAKAAPKSANERQRKHRMKKADDALRYVAILDMETDPFDAAHELKIAPFLAVLYSDEFEPVIIWEENLDAFIHATVSAIEGLPNEYTVYAHNGGKFDFLFLISKLRGEIMFKGRGIMSATIGRHELRDSFHIIPERLANYQKTEIDYEHMRKENRNAHRQEIIDYCIDDCKYLLQLVKGFLGEFGFKISIGQAALAELKKLYKFKTLDATTDNELRPFYFGGRVECLQGLALVQGHYKLYDVNSMYPAVMASAKHPVGNNYIWRPGEPGASTCFVELTCRNDGALVARVGEETTTAVKFGRFFTTIHEYRMALKYDLISEIEIHQCVDCLEQTDFRDFVEPRYTKRQAVKEALKTLGESGIDSGAEFERLKMDDIFLKLLLNNAYGKFAQNPRRYKENYITGPDEAPPPELEGYGFAPIHAGKHYWIWERPAPPEKLRFKNVGTAASITGAARAVLMEAIQHADDPIYCDTDSLICRELNGLELHKSKLGAWDLEAEFSEVIVCGKKLYSCRPLKGGKDKVRSKGASGLKHETMRALYEGAVHQAINSGVTITRTGSQHYMKRRIRATAKPREVSNGSGNVRHPLRAQDG